MSSVVTEDLPLRWYVEANGYGLERQIKLLPNFKCIALISINSPETIEFSTKSDRKAFTS